MQYNNADLIEYMDADTIKALLKIYDIPYKRISFSLGFTKQNLVFLLKHDKLKPHQREAILEILQAHSLEASELILIHHMVKKSKKVTT